MRKSAAQLVAGVALLGVAGGWAAGAAGNPPKPAAGERPAVTDPRALHVSQTGFTGQLVAFDSCAGLLDALQARGRAMVGPYGFQTQDGNLPAALAQKSAVGDFASSAPGVPSAASAPSRPSGPSSTGSSDAAAAPLTHSTTNTQVADVDEPDGVKTDGRYLVSLDRQLLHIVDVRTARLRATLALPHPGSELLLAGDRVVVLSGGSSSSGIGGGSGGIAPLSNSYYGGYATSSSTTATVVDIADPDAPRVVRSWTFDAGELAARVVGGTIRLVLTSPPPSAAWSTPRDGSAAEQARATRINQSVVDATALDAWLPLWTGDDGRAHRLSGCDAVATPTKANGVGLVTVVSLDQRSTRPGAGTSVFGAGDAGYAEGHHLYISDTGTYPVVESEQGVLRSVPPASVHLLEFDLSDPVQARHLAAGSVAGQLHDSYALSEYQDRLRVTTTTYDTGHTANPIGGTATSTGTGISVLERQGDKLVPVGRLGGLGAGEQVYAVRYISDRGYVVSFQRVDPLHVVDLSHPEHPVLRGNPDDAGLFEPAAAAAQPSPAGYRAGVQTSNLGCGGDSVGACPDVVEPDGLQLALFDVADAAHPRLLDRHVLPNGYASAVSDPHAVTLDPSRGFAVLPSSSGLLGVQLAGDRLTTTTSASTTPYSAQADRTVIAGERLFELTDRGVAVRSLPALYQTGWVTF